MFDLEITTEWKETKQEGLCLGFAIGDSETWLSIEEARAAMRHIEEMLTKLPRKPWKKVDWRLVDVQ